MNELKRLLFVAACLLILLTFSTTSEAFDIAVGGDGHMPEYDVNCAQINGTMERIYPGFEVVRELSFAFYGGAEDNADLCLTTLQNEESGWIDSLAFLITELDGMVLEEITEPIGTKLGPLESCWPKGVFFADYNNDEMNDILLMISCYNKETDQPENDNVVYLSTISEDLIWRRQTEEMNKVVANFANPNRARKALLAATSRRNN